MKKTANKPGKQWVVAHRGASYDAPENTRAAFKAALKYPVDGIECDVQLTGDGVPVHYHDRTIARFTGIRKRISDFYYSELFKMDWGEWFSELYKGEHIATLDSTLRNYSGKTKLFIEIKSRERDRVVGRSLQLTDIVLELLKKRVPGKKRAGIFILSFDPEVLEYAFNKAPGWKYVLNLKTPGLDAGKFMKKMKYLDGFNLPVKKLNKKFVNSAHAGKQLVMTYSCNVSRQVKKAVDMSADVIMTDRPGWLMGLIK